MRTFNFLPIAGIFWLIFLSNCGQSDHRLKDPQSLPSAANRAALENGRSLFVNHCASCHPIMKINDGVRLENITQVQDRKWLYAFTRNSDSLIRSGDRYARALYEQCNKVPMTRFPSLTDTDIDDIFRYIDSASQWLGYPSPNTARP